MTADAEQDLMERLRRPAAVTKGADVGKEGRPSPSAKSLYFDLLEDHPTEASRDSARQFLRAQLDKGAAACSDLPADFKDLSRWLASNTAEVGRQFRRYLSLRQSGDVRRYFPTKSHALHFLTAVAPTKLVDGAWLYGLVGQWRDARYAELIRIYLEELGEGVPDQNHVVIYKSLLAKHECERWQTLDEPHFVQGAIQLSLAQHPHEFLPEIIGFNLGYEQLPLHLLICAYELNELGIDPHYFTLHVTIDNAASGHAARAVRSVSDAMPQLGDKALFYQRVHNGYRLNTLGAGTNDVIARFDLEQELFDILASKAVIGADLHSDYCRVAGKTVREWLSTVGQTRAFVQALVQVGWIRRHEDPQNSRFWTLIEGEKAPMFGVFNAYERQVIYDWIAGDASEDALGAHANIPNPSRLRGAPPRHIKGRGAPQPSADVCSTRRSFMKQGTPDSRAQNDFDAESRLLSERLAKVSDPGAAMDLLVQWLSPVHHHTEVGLQATRIFAQRLRA